MTMVPVMWSVWGTLVAILSALILYRMSLTRDEEDQLFLDDSFDHEKDAQAAIVNKVNKLAPAVRLLTWATGAMTALMFVYYVALMINQLR